MNWRKILDGMNDAARWVLFALVRAYWFTLGITMAMALAWSVAGQDTQLSVTQMIAFGLTVSVIGLVLREAFNPRK